MDLPGFVPVPTSRKPSSSSQRRTVIYVLSTCITTCFRIFCVFMATERGWRKVWSKISKAVKAPFRWQPNGSSKDSERIEPPAIISRSLTATATALQIVELVNRIIDHLHHDRQTLAVCSQVCRFWNPSSRYHLFRAISIRSTNSAGFLDLLKSPNSTLAPVVRRLWLNDGPERWVGKAMRKLVRLHEVDDLGLANLDWRYMGAESADLFHSFQNVTSLELMNSAFETFDEIASLICAFPILRHLRLTNISWTSRSANTPPPRCLYSLTFGMGVQKSDVLGWLLTSNNDFHINKLDLGYVERRETLVVGNFLRALRRLRSLILAFSQDLEENPTLILRNIDLRQNTSLRSLCFISNPQPNTSARPMAWVLTLLSQISSAFPQMEDVDFWVNFVPDQVYAQTVDWAYMDNVFARSEFAMLHRIRICLHHLPIHGRPLEQSDSEYIEQVLPLCEARGILQFIR